jgi:Na+/melibiose symporter-like transporter
LLALSQGGVSWAWTSRTGSLLLVSAALLGVAFVVRERQATEPVVPPWVWRTWAISVACLIRVIAGAIAFGLTAFLPYFTQALPGASPVTASTTLIALGVAWPVGSAISGWLVVRIGSRSTVLMGAASWMAGGLALSWLFASASLIVILACCAALGVGTGLVMPSTMIGVQQAVDWERRGVATSTVLFAQALGGALGTALFGALSNSASHGGGTSALDGADAQPVFLALTALAATGFVLALTMPGVFRQTRGRYGG